MMYNLTSLHGEYSTLNQQTPYLIPVSIFNFLIQVLNDIANGSWWMRGIMMCMDVDVDMHSLVHPCFGDVRFWVVLLFDNE